MIDRPKVVTEKWVAEEIDRLGLIFATVQGRLMLITHDEEVTGIYAWPDGEDAADASFGDDDDGAYPAIAAWLNSDGTTTEPETP